MPRPKGVLVCLVLAVALGGCGISEQSEARFYAWPGQFELFDCPRLAQRATALSKREQELQMLMAKAGDDATGRFVSATTYRAEYLSVRGQLGEIAKVGARKNCIAPPPSPSPKALPPPPPTPKEQHS